MEPLELTRADEAVAEDLETAAQYIARDSASYAAAFVQEVKAAAASLIGDEIIEDEDFMVTFRRSSVNVLLDQPDLLNERQKLAIDFLKTHGSITTTCAPAPS